jgi:hypothetical protein
MTWIYIPDSTFSTVSPAMAGSLSDSGSLTRTPTSGRSPISNGTDTVSKSSANVSATDSWMTLQSGEETSENLMASPGVESWIFSLRVHHAPVSRSPETALEARMTEICSRKRSDWLTRYDRATSSWKMSQVSLWEDDPIFGTFSADWPRSGYMNAVGMLYRLKMPKRLTNGPAGGASPVWMTPNTMDSLSAKSQQALDHEHETARPGRSNPNNLRDQVSVSEGQTLWHIPPPTSADVYTGNMESSQQSEDSMHSVSLPDFVNRWPTPTPWQQQESIQSWTERRERERAKGRNGNGFGIPLDTAARLWATPTINDSKNNGSPSQQECRGSDLNVQAARMLPTPSASPSSFYQESLETWEARRDRKFTEGINLHRPLGIAIQQEARLLPTPSSGGDSGGPHGIRDGSWAKEKLVETFGEEDAVAMSGGSLSPDWVSWLMGLPVGWTSLEPLPREEYDQWLQMQRDGTWWAQWWGPWWFDCPSIATGIKDRVNRLKCLGNGIVPASLALFLRGTR